MTPEGRDYQLAASSGSCQSRTPGMVFGSSVPQFGLHVDVEHQLERAGPAESGDSRARR